MTSPPQPPPPKRPVHIDIYEDDAGEWRWTAKAANGQTVSDSSEGYVNKQDAKNMAETLFPNLTVNEEPHA